MLLEQPYDSRTFKHFDKSGLTYLVNRYIVGDYSELVNTGKVTPNTYKKGNIILKDVVMVGGSQIETDIEQLTFPVIFKEKGWMLKDYRSFHKFNKQTGEIVTAKTVALPITKTRDDLIALWACGYQNEMYTFKLPHLVYAEWLSSLIVNSVGIRDLNTKLQISCLALIYYVRQFSNEREPDEKELIKVRFKDTMYNHGMLDQVYDASTEMETLEDFCSHISKVTGNIRLKDFNVPLLFRITQTSWSGQDYKKTLEVALEYPPLWIFMCLTALTNNMYKKTQIGSFAENIGKRGEAQNFVKQIDIFLNENIGG